MKNTGSAAGDEVVELYLTQPKASDTPIRVLAGFTRVHLDPGQSTHVGLIIDPRSIAQVDSKGTRVILPGDYTVSLAGHSRATQPQFKPENLPLLGQQNYPNRGLFTAQLIL